MKTHSFLPSQNPPGGLSAFSVPQFVSFGSDDNGYESGIRFFLETLNGCRNAPGRGNAATFDGEPALMTFFMTGRNVTENPVENVAAVRQILRTAVNGGNELAIHTFSHPHGMRFDETRTPVARIDLIDASGWEKEIERCIASLVSEVGISRADISGFRTPYLEYNDGVYSALERCGLVYDASVLEGFQPNHEALSCLWPYPLDAGSPGDAWSSERIYGLPKPVIGNHPGLREMPCYAFTVPPDEQCEAYGTKPGFRARMKNDKVAGIDWNLWFERFIAPDDALALLKYNFDARYQGNRCPFLFAVHSDIYADQYDVHKLDREALSRIQARAPERRDVLARFAEYVHAKPDVRVTSYKNVMRWLEHPVSL